MTREILFRGKSIIGREWQYGYLMYSDQEEKYYIGVTEIMTPVIPETIGQFTGLFDKNGNKIFEGDVINSIYFMNSEVKFIDGYFDAHGLSFSEYNFQENNWEIIGNIHDNPDLL